MTRISKDLSFFRKNYYSLFGGFWLILALFYFLSHDWDVNKNYFNIIMCIGYFIIAALYLYQAYQNRGNNGEYIEWDEESIIYKPSMGKTHSYKIQKLTNLTVATNNLIIKAPNARGTMAPLKGYSEEDIQKLRKSFPAS
tara:strand:+ start:216 stop:635 length:420 start_codon:yes stop_codon:yes gene_type:complete